VLEPIQFERTGNEAAQDPEYVTQCAAFVESRMQDGLDRLEQKRKEPLERS
jgi:hypothetical protein